MTLTGSALGSHASRHAAGGADPLNPSTTGTPQHSFWLPEDHGLIAWAFDPSMTSSSGIPTAGQLQMVRLKIPVACTITNIVVNLNTGGSVLTSGESFAGLFNASRGKLSITADQSTAWQSSGLKTMALAAAQAVAAGDVFVGFYWGAGTTGPTFARGASSNSLNAGLSTANSRYATADTGLTTTVPGTAATLVAGTNSWWVAVS